MDNSLSIALKTLNRGTKKSKAFEAQHLIKKIKSTRDPKPNNKNKKLDPQALEADLVKLKAIDVAELSKKYLYTRLKRQSSQLIHDPVFSQFQNAPESTKFDRMENKICSHKSLADLISQVVSKLILELNKPSLEPTHSSTLKAVPQKQKSQDQPKLQVKPDPQGNSDEEELLTGDELDEAVAQELLALKTHQDENSSDHASSSQPSQQQLPTSSPKKSKKSADHRNNHPFTSRPVTCSTFLPALNVGFTLGDVSDESDLDDLNDPLLDKMERERDRKNRRGQRARRAIWEKKYGKSAKHLIKLNEKNKPYGREQSRTEKTQHIHQEPRNKRFKPNSKNDANKPIMSGSNLEPLSATSGPKQPVADPSLHPSWIAKQNLLHAASIVKSAGKKTVFS